MVSLTNEKKAPMAVPILFVPGIMGSRLCNEDGEVVWDPPGASLSAKLVGAVVKGVFDDADDRKQRLIGKPGDGFNKDFLHVAGTTTSASHRADKKHWKGVVTAPPGPEKIQLKPTRLSLPVALSLAEQPHRSRGWGTVHWESYGPFLQSLETCGAEISQSTGNCHVYLPVYACGYNWTASNADSAQTLSDWIDVAKAEMEELGLSVEKVLIISHSMGGFVSRYCTMGKTARAKDVHAICHIAMPDNGSPATYKRMKAGFEGSEKIVLGANGQEVTAVLAHAPGGLELLPNTHYRQADGSQGCWLTLEDRDEALPLFKGSPYDSVYREADKWWRLINPAWVEPSDEIDQKRKEKMFENMVLKGTLKKAKTFHTELGQRKHPNTWLIYSANPAAVWDKVQWKLVQRQVSHRADGSSDFTDEQVNRTTARLQALAHKSVRDPERGEGNITLASEVKTWPGTTAETDVTLDQVSIQPGSAAGDGTVHRGAGHYDKDPGIREKISLRISDDHQAMVNNQEVQDHVEDFIKVMLCNFAQCSFTDWGVQPDGTRGTEG